MVETLEFKDFTLPLSHPARVLSSRLKAGDILCIMGRNGIGKTTLLKEILEDSSEAIWIDNQPLSSFSPREKNKLISYMGTEAKPVFDMSVGEYSTIGLSRDISSQERQAIAHATGVTPWMDRSIHQLSDGQYQAVKWYRALLRDTPLYILDEPTAHLDLAAKIDWLEQLSTWGKSSGKIILFTSHDIQFAWKFASINLLLGEKQHLWLSEKKELPLHLAKFFHVPDWIL